MNDDRRAVLLSLLALGASSLARATEAVPSGRLVYGFGATPVTNTLLPPVMAELQRLYRPSLGSNLVTLPGNAGQNALRSVMQAPPDGATALFLPSSVVTLAYKSDANDPLDQIFPVAAVTEFSLGFAVGPAVPPSVTDMRGYLDWVDQNSMQARVGVVGQGAGQHFVGNEIANRARVDLRAEPYKSGAAQLEDLRNGHLPAAVAIVYSATDALSQPSIRLLAHSGDRPLPGLPSTPTLVSLGLLETPVVESFGVFLSRRVDPAKARELGAAIDQALATAAVRDAIASVRMYVPGTTSQSYAASLVAERETWRTRIARSGFAAS